MTLLQANLNTVFEVTQLSGPDLIVERLSELGIYSGKILQVVGQIPFSGPLIIRAGSQVLALRVEEAKCIQIKAL